MEPKRTVQFWGHEDFTSCTEETTHWSWVTTLSQAQLSARGLWRLGHGRWDIENDGFNTLATHWGMNHCFKHTTPAIVNFLLTLFIVYALLLSFWLRNPKPTVRAGLTLIGLARELNRQVIGCRAP